MVKKKVKTKREFIAFFIVSIILVITILFAIRTGSLKVGIIDFFKHVFTGDNEQVNIIVDLRLPRIIISAVGGGCIAVAGVLFQAVMKNSLADPGLLGISSGASLSTLIIMGIFPQLILFSPIFAFIGGIGACFFVYTLAWRGGLEPYRVVLVGIAVNAVFLGLIESVQAMMGNSKILDSVLKSSLAFKNWGHVEILVGYCFVFLILAILLAARCDLIAMEDRTIASLGVNVTLLKVQISVVAVFLAGISTVILGPISFLGLLAPSISRIAVGTRHIKLIPFSMLTGAALLVIADTIGRTVAAPNEIGVGIVMAIIGGPCFILLLKKTGGRYGA